MGRLTCSLRTRRGNHEHDLLWSHVREHMKKAWQDRKAKLAVKGHWSQFVHLLFIDELIHIHYASIHVQCSLRPYDMAAIVTSDEKEVFTYPI